MEKNFPHRRYLFVLALVLALALSFYVTGCDKESAASPQEVAQSFMGDLRHRDFDSAMEAIWPPTREQIEGPLLEIFDHHGSDELEQALDMLVVTRAESPMLISRMNVDVPPLDERSSGQAITLTMEFRDGRQAEMTLRWGDDRWYVDLPVEDSRLLEVFSGEERASDSDDEESDDDRPHGDGEVDSELELIEDENIDNE